jgi:hypothetical protein
VISAQVEGIPIFGNPSFPTISAAMSFKESSSYVIHMLAPPRLAIDRFDIQQFIWENALDTIELVSFLDVAEGA